MLEVDLRASEVARLKVRDVDLTGRVVVVRDRVGNYVTSRAMPQRTWDLIRRYLAENPVSKGSLLRFY